MEDVALKVGPCFILVPQIKKLAITISNTARFVRVKDKLYPIYTTVSYQDTMKALDMLTSGLYDIYKMAEKPIYYTHSDKEREEIR